MSFVTMCVLAGMALLSVTAISLALIAVRMNKQSTLQQEALLAQQAELIHVLKHKLELSETGFHGMGKKMVEMEKRLAKAMQKTESIDSRDPHASAYKHAMNLVDRGAAVEDIVKSCGLSRSEAELVKVLKSQLASDTLVRSVG